MKQSFQFTCQIFNRNIRLRVVVWCVFSNQSVINDMNMILNECVAFFADIRACDSNPCKNGATCVSLIHDYRCVCREGYVGKSCNRSKLYPITMYCING